MTYHWIVLPLIGALIGWWTNHIALWMLFHPRKPIRLPGWTWQGVIPGRREVLAENLSRALNEHLLTSNDIKTLLQAIPIETHLDRIVTQTLQKQVPREFFSKLPALENLREKLIDVLRREILKRLPATLGDIDEATLAHLAEDMQIAEHIRTRLMELPLDDLEQMIRRVARRELRAIELAGAGLGLLIGVVQAAVLLLIQ